MKNKQRKEFDILIFIGRFQIFHKGHEHIIKEGLKRAKTVYVLVGSSGQARSLRNPFTYEERKKLIQTCDPNINKNWSVEPFESYLEIDEIPDYGYRDLDWIAGVQRVISKSGYSTNKGHRIGLIGHSKDSSSYYLKLFPQWDNVEIDNYEGINSTQIRETFFEDTINGAIPYCIAEAVTKDTENFLQDFISTDEFNDLNKEYQFSLKYKKQFSKYPYPPTFQCTDAVVIQSGHVLMIERKDFPGKGLWALPGGFVNSDETLEQSMIRELREETGLKIPDPVLKGSMLGRKTFDMVHRSTRGRTFTEAFYIKLKDDIKLPKVKGGDDASKTFWVPIGELEENQCFEDHYSIIWKLINKFS